MCDFSLKVPSFSKVEAGKWKPGWIRYVSSPVCLSSVIRVVQLQYLVLNSTNYFSFFLISLSQVYWHPIFHHLFLLNLLQFSDKWNYSILTATHCHNNQIVRFTLFPLFLYVKSLIIYLLFIYFTEHCSVFIRSVIN